MYETGVMIAVAFSAITFIKNIFRKFSVEASNYETIGKKLSILGGDFEDIGPDKTLKFLKVFAFSVGLFCTIVMWALSWVSVAFSILIWCHLFLDILGLPEFVKEGRWKIKNIRLSKRQMLTEILKLNNNYTEENLEMALCHVNEKLSELDELKAS